MLQYFWPHIILDTCTQYTFNIFCKKTSVDTEMCFPKGKCGCQYFILLTLKKKKFMDTGVLDFLIKN